MRYNFRNIERPKKATANIATKIGASLSFTRESVAQILGYANWHDLERNHAKGRLFTADEALSQQEFVRRHANLSCALADKMRVPNGDAQYALAESRLTGNRPCVFADQLKIRAQCFRLTTLQLAGKRKPGEVGRLKLDGKRDAGLVILRSYTDRTHVFQPGYVISHRNVTSIASYEYVSPRTEQGLFIPAALYIPYGYYIEHDGAKVLYSRDYKPLWRIREGKAPERVEPWLWIKHSKSVSLWHANDKDPWDDSGDRAQLEATLTSFGVSCLPILADALPLLVHNDKLNNFSDAATALEQERIRFCMSAA